LEDDFDFDQVAANFDQFLPVIAPVIERMVERMAGLVPGTSVLDVACGTGEPGLTLLGRNPGVRLLGVDTSATMVGIATTKAADRGLTDARFEVMDSRHLEAEDDSTDVAVSRFGLLSFADPATEACELARVLRPGGSFTIATWDAGSKNTITYAAATAVRPWLPPQGGAAMDRQEQFAMPGRREAWLSAAGFPTVHSELFAWRVPFPDESSLWALATGPAMLGAVIGELAPARLAQAHSVFIDLLADYRRPDGSYIVPYACRVLRGSR